MTQNNTENNVPNFEKDLVNLLNDLQNPIKDSEITYLSRKASKPFMYASLSSVLQTVKEILPKYNFALSQATVQNENKTIIQTRLIHASGKWYTDGGVPLIARNTSDPHQLGSSITYAKRYGLLSLLGLDGDDDNDASDMNNVDNMKIQQRG